MRAPVPIDVMLLAKGGRGRMLRVDKKGACWATKILETA